MNGENLASWRNRGRVADMRRDMSNLSGEVKMTREESADGDSAEIVLASSQTSSCPSCCTGRTPCSTPTDTAIHSHVTHAQHSTRNLLS